MTIRSSYEDAEKSLDAAAKIYAILVKNREEWASNPREYFIALDIAREDVEKATDNATKVFWENVEPSHKNF